MDKAIILTLLALINIPGVLIKPAKGWSIFALGFCIGTAMVSWALYFKGVKF